MEHITAATFEEKVLKAEKPVVVDFWATWCGPCKMIAPILEELDQERDDIEIVKVDVDEQMDLATRYKVVSIPTVMVFRNGEAAEKAIGYMPKEELCRTLGI